MIGEADHCARGGTCCSLVLGIPFAPANSRSLDCEDRPLRGRSSSLGMTEFTNVYLLWHTWKHAFQSSSECQAHFVHAFLTYLHPPAGTITTRMGRLHLRSSCD